MRQKPSQKSNRAAATMSSIAVGKSLYAISTTAAYDPQSRFPSVSRFGTVKNFTFILLSQLSTLIIGKGTNYFLF